MKKRVVSILLALCMVLTLLPAEALAAEWRDFAETRAAPPEEPEGPLGLEEQPEVPFKEEPDIRPYAEGDTVTWTLDNGGSITVDMSGTVTGGTPGSDGAIAIPAEIPVTDSETGEETETISVTTIGGHAFYNCSSLTSVDIPESVTTIGESAFSYCRGLTSVNIPESVTTIGESAFSYCRGLTSVNIPESVTTIERSAFSDCSGLTSVDIPESVTTIGNSAFSGCSSLTSVDIPASVTSIGGSAFSGCEELTDINIPDSVISIGARAFSGCTELTSIIIPNGVTSIGDSMFYVCSKLTSITIPDSVTEIGISAFGACTSLESLVIPDSVVSIGCRAFAGCTALEHLRISSNIQTIKKTKSPGPIWKSSLFANCPELKTAGSGPQYNIDLGQMTTIPASLFDLEYVINSTFDATYLCDTGYIETIIIPDSVTSIGDYAFRDCTSLKTVHIPDSVTTISQSAFKFCQQLTSVNLPDSLTGIGKNAFQNCNSLTSVTIPDNVTTIADYTFSGCSGLIDVTIPGSVTSIGNSAFAYCSSLLKVDFPNNLSSIGNYTFYRCSGLTSIIIPDSVTSMGYNTFAECTGLTSAIIPKSVTKIGSDNFAKCTNLITAGPIGGDYDIQFGWTDVIPDNAFSGYANLKSVSIPESVTNIGSSAFSGCTGLTGMIIPNSVTSIGGSAFNNCTGLKSVIIPDSVTSIGGGAFSGCTGLTSAGPIGGDHSIQFGWTEMIPADAFNGSWVAHVTIPETVLRIGRSAFNFTRITEIDLPDSLTSIGDYAFLNCYYLPNIIIPLNVKNIGERAFHDILLYCYPGSYAVEYAEKNNIDYELLGMSGRILSVSLLDENGDAVTSGFTVVWYDDGGDEIGTGSMLSGADTEKTYAFEIRLGDALSALYEQLVRQTVAPADAARHEVRLVRKAAVKTLTLSGRVRGQNGEPIPGAAVSVIAADGDPAETVTDADGGFSVEVPRALLFVTIRMDGYYSKWDTLDLTNETGDAHDAGAYTLTPVQVLTDRLTLSVTQRRAAESPDTAVEMPLTSPGALKITLAGSGGRSITDFEVQGLTLLFRPGAVSAGETVTVTIDDPGGAYRAASASAVLDSDRLGTAELTMVQKGGFVLGGVSGPEANLLVFDSAGNCVRTSAAVSGLTGGAMEPGTYQAVLLQRSELLRGVSSLSYLGTFGLREGQDYLLRQFTVADGRIVRLDDCAVPPLDESRIFYTVAENTGVTAGKSGGVTVGDLLLIRAAYELDASKGAAASALQIALPEGIALVNSSVLIGNEPAAYTYDEASREVSIRMNGRGKAVVRLYCTPVKSGNYSVSAFLTLSNGAVQPTGAAVVRAEEAKLEVPARTGKASGLTASGKTRPGSTVTLYDNGTEVGRATANAAGSWSMSFNLVQPVYSYSYHNVYAVMEGGLLTEPITTESVLVTYDKRLDMELEKITMYNTGDHGAQETVFDFTSESAKTPYYRMWPSVYPTFTFKAEFSGDASKLSEVYVVTVNSAGDETYVKMAYDAASGAWVGTHKYTSFADAPAAVTAAYGFGDMEPIPFDEEMAIIVEDMVDETSEKILDTLSPLLNESIALTNLIEGNNFFEGTIVYNGADMQGTNELGTYRMEYGAIESDVNAKTLSDEGYITITDNANQVWVKITSTETSIIERYVDLNDHIFLTLTTKLNIPSTMTTLLTSSSSQQKNSIANPVDMITATPERNRLLDWGYDFVYKVEPFLTQDPSRIDFFEYSLCAYSLLDIFIFGKTSDNLTLSWLALIADIYTDILRTNDNIANINNQFNGMYTELLEDYNEAVLNLLEKCPEDGNLRLSSSDFIIFDCELRTIEQLVTEYRQDMITLIFWGGFLSGIGTGISSYFKARLLRDGKQTGSQILSKLTLINKAYSTMAKDKNLVYWSMVHGFNYLDGKILDLSTKIIDSYQPCGKEESPKPENDMMQPTSLPSEVIQDPSGYVYEAVPSNRLPGVTAVISSESGGTWNAADYDQRNPQITGADGGFYWDVPEGNWKVSFAKDGYQNADTSGAPQAVSGWLPVPPPQLDIGVSMISSAAPAVRQAAAYTDRVEIAFSQYMDIDSVRGAVTLSCDGSPVTNAVVTPLDHEYNLEGTAEYASRFAVTSGDGGLSGELVVSVGAGARNYAGTPVTASYASPVLTAVPRPTGIDAPDAVSAGLHGTARIAVTLLPGVAGQTLRVESLSPALVSVQTSSVTTGADGAAEIAITGILPGSGLIRVTEPVSGLSKTVAVNVAVDGAASAPETPAVAPVTAVLEDGRRVTDGMRLPRGAKITLRTATPGAVIRYTVNDTCPCTEDALFYSGPITVTEAIVLRAAACKDGVYSETIRLELSMESGENYVITFHPNGGTVGADTLTTNSDGKLNNLPVPTRGNYTFNGWFTASSGGNRVTTDTVFSGDSTVYAQWTYVGGSFGSSDGPGSTGSYAVSIPSRITGGAVKVSSANAKEGDTVTITVVPDDGYMLNKLTVAGSKGSKLPLTGEGNNQYTFIMPNSKVTVDVSFAPVRFTDVQPGAYYYDAVAWAAAQGITGGTSATTFSPDSSCTRAQIVTFLWRAAGSPAPTGDMNPFVDVQDSAYYYNAVMWAAEQRITGGTSAMTFSPDDTVTRGQTVTFLYRAAGTPDTSGDHAFADVAADAYYAPAVRWAADHGVTGGTNATTFSPDGNCTRAQIVTFLYRNRAN